MDGTDTAAGQEQAIAMGMQIFQTDTPWIALSPLISSNRSCFFGG